MCLYPKIIKNRKYTANKKNKGAIPLCLDERTMYVPVGCGNCMECRKQKARGWQVRLMEDIKKHTNGKFITLTFSTESITELYKEAETCGLTGYELDNQVATIAVRRFLERWRKKHKKSIRHWLVTELGHNGTENLHLHGIIWTDETLNEVEKHWQYGYMWKGKGEKKENYVNERTINYIIKYITKHDELHKEYKSIILTSPGIGKNYTENKDSRQRKFNGDKTIETYKTRTGHNIAMPAYWRNKIYTEQEREQLWIQKLDEGIRYVGGERVDAKQNLDEYFKLLEWYRRINKKLGYGTDEKNWERKEYEKQLRNLKIKERIEKKFHVEQK